MSARRLSVVQQVHHQEAPTGGAVYVSCPPHTHTYIRTYARMHMPTTLLLTRCDFSCDAGP